MYVVISDLVICRYVSDTSNAIEAGIQAGRIKALVLAVCLMSKEIKI